jgi:hypothetical protein
MCIINVFWDIIILFWIPLIRTPCIFIKLHCHCGEGPQKISYRYLSTLILPESIKTLTIVILFSRTCYLLSQVSMVGSHELVISADWWQKVMTAYSFQERWFCIVSSFEFPHCKCLNCQANVYFGRIFIIWHAARAIRSSGGLNKVQYWKCY